MPSMGPPDMAVRVGLGLLASPCRDSAGCHDRGVIAFDRRLRVCHVQAENRVDGKFALVFCPQDIARRLDALRFVLELVVPPQNLQAVAGLGLVFG